MPAGYSALAVAEPDDAHALELEPLDAAHRPAAVPPRWLGRVLHALPWLLCALLSALLIVPPSVAPAAAAACPPDAFDAGQWVRRADAPTALDSLADYYAAAGVTGCAAEHYMFPLADLWADLVAPVSYRWQPHARCRLRESSAAARLQRLVDAPLLLVGDSLSYQHFYSLSCALHSHVRWTGVVLDKELDAAKGRESLQHLGLDPASPLLPKLRLPRDFDFDRPLVSFQLASLPLSRAELKLLPDVDAALVPNHYDNALFERVYATPMNASHDLFLDSPARYGTMLASWGSHYSPGAAFPGASPVELQRFMRASAGLYLRALAARLRPDQRVYVRAAPPGHDPTQRDGPLAEVPPPGGFHNWPTMPDLNDVLRQQTILLGDARVQWIGGERALRLRPDAKIRGDGQHYIANVGALETWTTYLWHLMTPARPA